jgi:hypothetical protein
VVRRYAFSSTIGTTLCLFYSTLLYYDLLVLVLYHSRTIGTTLCLFYSILLYSTIGTVLL